eukprot:g4349.t1
MAAGFVVALLLAAARAAQKSGRQCYTNGDGVSAPTLEYVKTYCEPDEWCVAENHYGSTAAALWPLDARGEKCYRMCKKMKTDSTWDSFYQDKEQTIRVFARDNSDVLTMTCYQDLCNEKCLDEDAAAGLAPSAWTFMAALLATLVLVVRG